MKDQDLLENFSRNPEAIQALDAAWERVTEPQEGWSGWEPDRIWAKVVSHQSSLQTTRKRSSWWNAAWIVPVLAIIVIKYVADETLLPLPAPQQKTYVTTSGQRATITLADSSNVILAPGTTLRAKGREVYLDGQAAFTVTQNNDSPFTVTTGNTAVRVLGTTFNVRRYSTDNSTSITVALGKVAVANDVLSAGDRIRVLNNGEKQLSHGVDIRSELGWTSGNLVLDEEHFRDAIPQLERWYGIKVRASGALLNRSVRAELQTESVWDAVEILAFTLNARVERNGTTINFIPK